MSLGRSCSSVIASKVSISLSDDPLWSPTDACSETQAALEAGVTPVVVVRKGNAPLSDEEKKAWEGKTIGSFEQFSFR